MHKDAEAIEQAVRRILAIEDPVELVAAATDALEAVTALRPVRRARLTALNAAGGLSMRELSARVAEHGTALSKARIQQIIKGEHAGVARPENSREQQAELVRELAGTATSQAEIGRRIGVSGARVGQIIAELPDAQDVRDRMRANRGGQAQAPGAA